MEVVKTEQEDGTISLSRRDVYNGMSVRFIPFRNDSGASYSAPVLDDNVFFMLEPEVEPIPETGYVPENTLDSEEI
jgi:hypothetical protein